MALGSMSRIAPLKYLVKAFIWVIRGTPLMLQIFIVWFLPIGIKNRMLAVIIAFSINYAAYFAEIYRGGIQSIPKGQDEAARVLGLTKSETFFKIKLPQVIKIVLPSIGNEVNTLTKDTALASVISVMELMYVAKSISNSQASIGILFASGLFYLVFNGFVTIVFNFFEKKLSYYKA